jgi:protein-tyrosine phosphatase
MSSTGSSAGWPRSTRWLNWPTPMMTGVRGSRAIGDLLASRGVGGSSTPSRAAAGIPTLQAGRSGPVRAYNPDIEILVLCTANICRSPLAEALLRQRLDMFGVDDVNVRSAGFLAEGQQVADGTLRVLHQRKVPIEGLTVSTRVTGEMLGRSDLILAMARLHVREAVMLNRYVFDRTFTLKELVRLANDEGARRDDESFDDWLRRLGDGRTPADHMGESDDDDVADPIGAPARVFKRTASELEELVDRLVGLAWPLHAVRRDVGEVAG